MIYLILVNSSLILCYLLYIFFFRRLTFFQLNRGYLLGAVLVSLIIPVGLFIELPSRWFMEETLPVLDLKPFMIENFVLESANTPQISLRVLLQLTYWGGVAIGFIWLLFRLVYVSYLVGRKKSSFSFAFFHRVVLGEQEFDSQIIASHEQVHVEQGHSYDILALELVRIFNWFNPVLYFYLKEIKFQHECIADEQCSQDKITYAELLVAQAMQVKSIHFLHEFSNKSILKNRIMMLFKDKSKRQSKWLYVTIAPVILLTTLSTVVFNTSNAKDLAHDLEAKVAATNLPISGLAVTDDLHNAGRSPKVNGESVKGMEEETKINAVLPPSAAMDKAIVDQKQDTSRRKDNKSEQEMLFTETEIMPEPTGGMANFSKWVATQYSYPQSAIDAGVKGKIIISFIVDANGNLSTFNVVQDLGHGTGEALVNVLKTADAWKPGIQNGRKVRVLFHLPMTLDLTP